MSTTSFSAEPIQSNASLFYAWAHRLSAAFKSFGWIQKADTGQVVWPVSIVSISNAVATGGVVTFTYVLQQGAALRVGGQIVVTNCTTSGLNTTYTIASLPLSNTFTASTATTVTEAETAWGSVNPQVSISNALGNGASNTYNYTVLDGTDPINGQSIVIAGCTTGGFNGTFVIATVNTGAGTFTTTTGITHASEAETGSGLVAANSCNSTPTSTSLPPTAGNSLFEIWGMGDALQSTFPVYVKFQFGSTATGATIPGQAFTLGTTTDGAGNFTGASSAIAPFSSASGSSASLATCFLSGSTNRINFLMFGSSGGNAPRWYVGIERSHDSSGNDTSSYVTGASVTNNSGGVVNCAQGSLSATQATQIESKLVAMCTHNTTTSAFGSSVLLCPLFPIVGAVGNPLTNTLIGKLSDFSDGSQFTFTMYGVTRTYQVYAASFTTAGNMLYDATPTAVLVYRYD